MRTGGLSGLSSALGIDFITGFELIGFPSYHRDLYTFKEMPNFSLASVMSFVLRQFLSMVKDPTNSELLSITMTSILHRTSFTSLREGGSWVLLFLPGASLVFDSSELEV